MLQKLVNTNFVNIKGTKQHNKTTKYHTRKEKEFSRTLFLLLWSFTELISFLLTPPKTIPSIRTDDTYSDLVQFPGSLHVTWVLRHQERRRRTKKPFPTATSVFSWGETLKFLSTKTSTVMEVSICLDSSTEDWWKVFKSDLQKVGFSLSDFSPVTQKKVFKK